jgi:hypothetical protein
VIPIEQELSVQKIGKLIYALLFSMGNNNPAIANPNGRL